VRSEMIGLRRSGSRSSAQALGCLCPPVKIARKLWSWLVYVWLCVYSFSNALVVAVYVASSNATSESFLIYALVAHLDSGAGLLYQVTKGKSNGIWISTGCLWPFCGLQPTGFCWLALMYATSIRLHQEGHSKLGSIKTRFMSTVVLKFGGRGFCLLGMSGGGNLLLSEDCSGKIILFKMAIVSILVFENEAQRASSGGPTRFLKDPLRAQKKYNAHTTPAWCLFCLLAVVGLFWARSLAPLVLILMLAL